MNPELQDNNQELETRSTGRGLGATDCPASGWWVHKKVSFHLIARCKEVEGAERICHTRMQGASLTWAETWGLWLDLTSKTGDRAAGEHKVDFLNIELPKRIHISESLKAAGLLILQFPLLPSSCRLCLLCRWGITSSLFSDPTHGPPLC